jgi:hypothetical protein
VERKLCGTSFCVPKLQSGITGQAERIGAAAPFYSLVSLGFAGNFCCYPQRVNGHPRNGTFVLRSVLMHSCAGRLPAPEWGFGVEVDQYTSESAQQIAD